MHEKMNINDELGIEVLFVDFSNLTEKEILEAFPLVTEMNISRELRYNIFDVSNTRTTSNIRDAAKKEIEAAEQVVGKIYRALVGVSGIEKMIAKIISKDVYFADDFEDAKRWIVEQSRIVDQA